MDVSDNEVPVASVEPVDPPVRPRRLERSSTMRSVPAGPSHRADPSRPGARRVADRADAAPPATDGEPQTDQASGRVAAACDATTVPSTGGTIPVSRLRLPAAPRPSTAGGAGPRVQPGVVVPVRPSGPVQPSGSEPAAGTRRPESPRTASTTAMTGPAAEETRPDRRPTAARTPGTGSPAARAPEPAPGTPSGAGPSAAGPQPRPTAREGATPEPGAARIPVRQPARRPPTLPPSEDRPGSAPGGHRHPRHSGRVEGAAAATDRGRAPADGNPREPSRDLPTVTAVRGFGTQPPAPPPAATGSPRAWSPTSTPYPLPADSGGGSNGSNGTAVAAPFAGVLTGRPAPRGRLVAPGRPVVLGHRVLLASILVAGLLGGGIGALLVSMTECGSDRQASAALQVGTAAPSSDRRSVASIAATTLPSVVTIDAGGGGRRCRGHRLRGDHQPGGVHPDEQPRRGARGRRQNSDLRAPLPGVRPGPGRPGRAGSQD